jgi:hypothetical protein
MAISLKPIDTLDRYHVMKHNTIPNEPQEAPVTPEKPEISQPADPNTPSAPQEAPEYAPLEVPQTDVQPEADPAKAA